MKRISKDSKGIFEKIKTTAKKIFKSGGKKVLKNGSYSIGLTIVVIAIAVIINMVVSEIPSQYTQFDFSEQKLYSVSDDTKEYLDSLDQDITIYYIAETDNEDSTVQKLLERMDDLSSHIKVEQKDPVVNPNFVSQYTDSEVTDNSVIVECGDKNKVVDYSQIYETQSEYGGYYTTTTGFDGEGQIVSAIEYVTSDDLPVMYTLEGHGEAELSDSITSEIEKENVELKSLNLVTEGEIPEDASALLICSPTSDFSSEEADQIIEYLENGGKALIFTDYVNEELTNVKRVLENYGVGITDGIIMEGDSRHYAYQMPYYLVPNLGDSDLVSELSEDGLSILIPAAQGIETLDEVRDSVELTPLLTTSSDAYSKTDVENMESYEKEEGDIDGPFNVGVYIKEEVEDNLTEIIYFSSSSLLNDSVDQMVSGSDTQLVINAVSALCKSDDSSSVSIPSKSLQMDYLTLTAFDTSFWMMVTIILIPGACILIGLVVWLKRRKK
jgi:ABC-2 type transport system permease protein